METIQSLQQLQGICQALRCQNVLSCEPISEEKDFDISVKEIEPYRFKVELSYIHYLVESKFENDEHIPVRLPQNTVYVNVGSGYSCLILSL